MIVGRAEPAAFELPISQEVMSDTLGLSVPHLNRMLTKLRNDKHLNELDREPFNMLISPSTRFAYVAHADGDTWVFVLRMQGEHETVFFDL